MRVSARNPWFYANHTQLNLDCLSPLDADPPPPRCPGSKAARVEWDPAGGVLVVTGRCRCGYARFFSFRVAIGPPQLRAEHRHVVRLSLFVRQRGGLREKFVNVDREISRPSAAGVHGDFHIPSASTRFAAGTMDYSSQQSNRALLGLAPSPARERDLSVSAASSADSADVAGGRGKWWMPSLPQLRFASTYGCCTFWRRSTYVALL